MSHLTRRRTDAAWARGGTISGADMAALDEAITKAGNGDEGGVYTPTAPVIIDGEGVGIYGPWTLEGGALVSTNGTPTSRIEFGKNTEDDAFVYDPAHANTSRALMLYMSESYPTSLTDTSIDVGSLMTFPQAPGVRFATPIYVHDGATIDSVQFSLKVRSSHAGGVPEYLPRFRIVRVSADGVVESLRAEDATTDFDGYQFFAPRPATGTAWYAAGATQTFLYTANQNNVVDLSKYVYLADIIEESGANAWSIANDGNRYVSTVTHLSGIARLSNRH